ncbi:MAG: protein translocase subunit SecF [Patescibacteria group bacterium]
MNVIRHKYLFLAFSGLLIAASIAALALWGLRLGVDFTGGSLMEIEFSGKRPPADAIRKVLEPLGLGTITLQPSGATGMLLRFKDVDEDTHQKIVAAVREVVAPEGGDAGVVEKRFDAVGPVIGADLYRRSLMALALAVAAIVAYIAWAFRRISKPIASWKYGVVTVAALIHDIAIPAGTFAALGRWQGVEVDLLFITALLTVLGFSVHDTIVVFDRIRENLSAGERREPYADTVNRSIRETFARSVATSLTVLLVLAAVFFFGGTTTRHFTFALIIGITAGTYSSIFVASPLLVVWESLTKK